MTHAKKKVMTGMRRRAVRYLVALALALPGIALAMGSKVFILGDSVLFAGWLLAFVLPILGMAEPRG